MMREVRMSPNDDDPEEVKKAKKKYLWFGYGNYDAYGTNAFQPVNIRADPSILDKLFELFGVKEKPKKGPEEDKK
jgi:hypothetical protein